jgi:hypothetical protein
MNEAERKFKAISTTSRKFTVPTQFWEEWETDCKDSFNNTYHLKMQFDHEFRKQFTNISALIMQDLVELKERVADLETQLQDKLTQSTDEEEKSLNDRSVSTRKTLG